MEQLPDPPPPSARTRTTGSGPPGRSLLRHRPFTLLCGEQIASSVGRQVTTLALALLAVTRLDAGPFGASALMALSYLPGALLSPFAGVLADRARLRTLTVLLTVLQVFVVGSVPLAAALGRLGLPQLYVVATASGALTSTLAVALQAALPRVVHPQQLLSANSALTGARTTGQIGGPALGGVLVGLTGASTALLAACAAYGVESLLLLALPAALNTPAQRGSRASESRTAVLRAGLEVVRGEKVLRRQVLAGAGFNLGSGAADALFVLYATRDLGLPAWQLGTVYAAFSVATVLGVLLAGRFAATIGLARATRICAVVAALAIFLIPGASLGPGFPALLAYQFLFGLAATVWAISMTTTQQLITPPELQGRVAGVLQAALIGTVPVGALGGGALASWLGNVPVLTGGAVVALVAAACLWWP
ncbi:MFS transporter [Streptomyces atratus]|uniref:Predicted arabinose efflux permease, MFS family n=1 Tax=Streptomyces atratus TaxID=1893 RepID=A0A1K2F6P9_STRAR|nr:MFS transporter [Streptomyces atratus]SFY42709.1 Predicted arabinose efflux permease, MFS family [Streptomyces atratus]